MRPRIWPTLTLVLLPLLFLSSASFAQAGPGDSDLLLRLAPRDAAVVVTVENLREHAGDFLKSSLAAALKGLPAVQAWFRSDKYRDLERARVQIEGLLGVDINTIRDEILGDALVLALRLPPNPVADGSQARGILLVKVRDRGLLERLIDIVNTAQEQSGGLSGVAQRQRAGVTYHVREFPPAAARPSEWYVSYPDGTFAFTNSEDMIHAVIDGKARGLSTDPEKKAAGVVGSTPPHRARLASIQSKLPRPALARLFIDPRPLERLLAAQPRGDKPEDARIAAILERYLAAVDFAGAALIMSDESIVIHSVETLDASALDPWIRHWAADRRQVDPKLVRVPPTALAVATTHIDAVAAFDMISQVIRDDDGARLANLETLLSGLLLGQDLHTQVLPRLGPGVIAYVDSPESSPEQGGGAGSKPAAAVAWPFPVVVVFDLGDKATATTVSLAAAADNAFRTVFAMMALDDKKDHGPRQIATRTVAGTTVTTMSPPISFAYAVDHALNRLVVSTSPEAIAGYLEHVSDPKAGDRLQQLRSAAGTNAETFAFLDLDAIGQLAARHHARLLQSLAAGQHRSVDLVDHDLSDMLALARLFRAGFVASQIEADATVVQRKFGLIRQPERRK